MFTIKHVLESLLNPFCLALLIFAFLLYRLVKHQVSKKLVLGFGLLYLLLLIISLGWLPHWLTNKLENKYPVVTHPDQGIHWVIVLSGGQAEVANRPPNTALYSASIKRLLEGIRLIRQLPAAKLLLSGGGYGKETAESVRMSQLADWLNIPQDQLILETHSLNTEQQAKAIKAWVQDQPFYLVTSAIHMPRAMALCQAQGLHPVAAPTDFTVYWQDERWGKYYLPNANNIVYLSIALHELLGRAWGAFIGPLIND